MWRFHNRQHIQCLPTIALAVTLNRQCMDFVAEELTSVLESPEVVLVVVLTATKHRKKMLVEVDFVVVYVFIYIYRFRNMVTHSLCVACVWIV